MEILINTEDLATPAEVAEALGVARVTVYKWIVAHKILGCRLGGRVYVARSEIERLKEERR